MPVPFPFMVAQAVILMSSWSHQESQLPTPLLAALESAASIWLAGTAGPTERSIVSVLWGSVVGASSQGPAPRHHQLSLGVVLASQAEGGEGVNIHRYPAVPGGLDHQPSSIDEETKAQRD